MSITTTRAAFLANDRNKTRLVEMLVKKMLVAAIHDVQPADADQIRLLFQQH